MFRARPNLVRPSEVSAKVQNRRPRASHDPGNIARGRPRHATTAHDQTARAGKRLAAAQLIRVPARRAVRAGKLRPTSGRDFIGQFTRPTTAADHASVRPRPFRLGHIPDCPADRPARPSQRRGRPEALFEAQTYVFKPGLTLAASRKT
ncbi:unnamed protein product [Microthlaspi erraticum]|uniref:Uncharacterized protein n=1 Tax=Microthlaspi erraticum TaxID=1685480 RepID=A0A6D2HVN8_9BRAS|nr:unnamed protein product [Microthlaspi erraticum]